MNATLESHDPGMTHGEALSETAASAAPTRPFRKSEAYLAAAQRLSRTGSFGWKVPAGEVYWSEETFRIFGYDSTIEPSVERALARVHPEDAGMMRQTLEQISREGKEFDFEFRLLMPEGTVKHLRALAHPEPVPGGGTEFIGAVMDITATKESEEKIRLIINSVPAQIWTMGADGRVSYFSERLLNYLGLTGEQSQVAAYDHYVHPDDAGLLRTHWRARMAEGKSFELEIRLRRFDGQYRWFLSCVSPARNADGNVVGWYGNNIDIHERKLAAEKLRESEAYLAEAHRLSRTGSWAWNPATNKLRYWSEENYHITGFDERDGMPPFERVLQNVPPDDRERFIKILEEAPRAKAEFQHEFRYVHPNGEMKELCSVGRPVLDAAGNLVEYVGTVMDQTERKRAQEALRSSEERLRLIVENIPGLLCTHTAGGELEFANQRLLDYTGRSLDGMRDWISLIHPDDVPRTLQQWERSVSTGQPYDIEHRTRGADGVYRWFHVCGLPLHAEEGRIARWYILLTHIDDRKRSEEALNKAQTELAHITRVTTMGELTASIAHEVNQPLAAVVNNANACLNLLPSGGADLGEVREALADIVEDADRASAVLLRIRQLARRAPYEKTSLDLRAVIADVLLLARGEAGARQTMIQSDLPREPLPILGDRVQLQQVLLNLVVNGMDAMKDIAIAKRILVLSAREIHDGGKPETRVRVRDAGTGLAPIERERLFEAFYSTKPQGMGMGLSISRTIIEAHGGRLWAEENEDDGATFHFSLPAAPMPSP